MIRIGELQIELPAELSHRATRISRLVKAGCEDLSGGGRLPRELALDDVVLRADASDAWIADRIVKGLQRSLRSGR